MTKPAALIAQKQQLILLKSQAKSLARKCRNRRRALDRAYALLILGLVLWAVFIRQDEVSKLNCQSFLRNICANPSV